MNDNERYDREREIAKLARASLRYTGQAERAEKYAYLDTDPTTALAKAAELRRKAAAKAAEAKQLAAEL